MSGSSRRAASAAALTFRSNYGALAGMTGRGTERSGPISRRQLLATLGAVGAGRVAGLPRANAGRLGPIGVQLYTVRTLLEKDFGGTLAALAAIGFREVEFAGYHGRPPEAVRDALDRAGLVAPAAHVPIDAVRDDLPRVLDAARLIGHRYLVVPSIPEGQHTTDGYRAVADLLNRAGQRVRDSGMQLAYHNHAFEFAALDGRVPYDILLERCAERLVAFEMDLYWITKGGGNPGRYFARWPGRFPLVHVKDSAGAPEHRMV
ncbi:MAG TPA: TIM barrel protein, partial [Methylomirabilota bacterium]